MSFKFSKKSLDKLSTCHPDLQHLMNELIKFYDVSILEGHRGEELQNLYFDQGRSKLKYPQSKHNSYPSMAVDVAPYPIDWNDRERFVYMGGIIKGLAQQLKIKIRWGGDWDSDNSFKDQTFHDLPHIELVEDK